MSYPNIPASGAGGSSKLPIPRLQKPRSEPPRKAPINRQNRVSRACLSCRSRKIKCNGLQPRCSNCSENATSCVYASSRKDRLKTAASHNQDMIALLRDLRQQVSSGGQDRIDDLLASVVEDVADAAATVQHPTDKYRGSIAEEDRGEDNVSAEVGSSGEPDQFDEDFLRNEETRATGFTGKTSEIQWLRQLRGVSTLEPSGGGPWGPPGEDDEAVESRLAALQEKHNSHPTPLMQTSKARFYLDDETFETDLMVDPFEMPPFETAERLLQAYMESAHNSFPFLAKKSFVSRFHHYYASLQHGNPYNVPRKWQTTLNLVFAIGAVYSHLTMADWRADDRDHLRYHSRAWSLSLKDPWWFSHPDLPHMQIAGLLSFYYLSIGHINRSWVLVGMAMRSGFALGMHLRNEDSNTGVAKKEVMSRIWWAHYALERLVSALTGRPSLGMGNMCSVPPPLPLSSQDIEESTIESRFSDKDKRPLIPQKSPTCSQPVELSTPQDRDQHTTGSEPVNSGSYLKSIVDLGEITQAALTLYGANVVRGSWESVQRAIAQENDELDAWATALPEGLNFFHRSHVTGYRYRCEQNTLEIHYYSTKILITRPCLCRLDRRISNQTTSSNDFSQRAALICVGAAKSIASLLPDALASNLVLLYQAGPWWQMVHVVMQALIVLILEIVLESIYFPNDRQEIIPSLKKLLRWLRIMRFNNSMAVRAYSISSGLLKKLASTIKIEIADLISEDEMISTPVDTSPVPSVPAQTHTPYPDVLNPVDEPPISKPSPPVPITARTLPKQQQQHLQPLQPQQQHQYTQDPPSTPQYLSEMSQYNASHLRLSDKTFHRPPIHGTRDPEQDLSAYNSLFLASSESEGVVFPGWFVTSFDEHNLLSGFGFDGENVLMHEPSVGHGTSTMS